MQLSWPSWGAIYNPSFAGRVFFVTNQWVDMSRFGSPSSLRNVQCQGIGQCGFV